MRSPLDYYDFMHGTFRDTPREKLLEYMHHWPDQEALQALSQPELAKRFSIWRALYMLAYVQERRGDG